MKYWILNIIAIFVFSANLYSQISEKQEMYFKAISLIESNNISNSLQIINQFPKDEHFLLLKADIHISNNELLQAIETYKKIALQNPSKAYYELAKLYASMGYETESMFYLEKHFKYPRPVSMPDIDKEQSFQIINKTTEWRSFWQNNSYSELQLKLQEAEYFINKNKNYEAIDILLNINTVKEKDILNYLQARAYFNLNNFNSSLKHISKAIEFKELPDYYLFRIQLYEENKEDILALTDVKSLIKIDSYNPDYLLLKAKIENNNKNYLQAKKDLDFYRQYFPNNEESLYYSAVVSSNLKQYDEALIYYNNLLDINPSKTEYFNGRAEIFFNYKNYDFALKDYTMSLDIDPQQADVYYNLGWCRYYLNSKEKACRAWFHATRLMHREAAKTMLHYCK